MYLFSIIALAGSIGSIAARPARFSPRAGTATFPAGSSWDILLSKGGDTSSVASAADDNFQVIDIDLFDTSKETIADLKATKRVICYFSAGTREGWRKDAGKFQGTDTGSAVSGGPKGNWPDELWLDVTSSNVRSIMKSRIELAAQSGCDAVDPDNVDGFDNETGFNHPKTKYVEYVKFMAQVAKDNNLAIGLKNAIDMIPDVVSDVDFAVNEQCHEYQGECAKYKPFTDQNKAVFNIEYGGNKCDSPAGVKLSTLIKSEDQGLNALGGACPGQGAGSPTQGQPTPSTPAATAPGQPKPTPTGANSGPGKVDGGKDTENGDDHEGNGENENHDGTDDDGSKEQAPPAPRPTATKGPGHFLWNWRGHRVHGN